MELIYKMIHIGFLEDYYTICNRPVSACGVKLKNQSLRMNHLTHSLAILMVSALSVLTGFGQSCIDPDACNYDPNAGTPDAVCLEIVPFATHDSGDLAGMTTWRVYFRTTDPADFVTAVYGNQSEPLSLTTTTSFYQNALGGPRTAHQPAAVAQLSRFGVRQLRDHRLVPDGQHGHWRERPQHGFLSRPRLGTGF